MSIIPAVCEKRLVRGHHAEERQIYMGVDINHGPEYGNTLTWTDQFHPQTGVRKVHAQLDLNLPRFQKLFLDLMTSR